jgi:hypothetical protein
MIAWEYCLIWFNNSMYDRKAVRPVRPHFDEYHDHEGVRCNPQRLIMTTPVEGMADLAIRAYEAETIIPSPLFRRKLERNFDEDLSVVTGYYALRYGILGFFESMPEKRFNVGDVSRATRLPGDRVSPYMKRLIFDGVLESELSTCPDETNKVELVYMKQRRERHKRRTFSLQGLLPQPAKTPISFASRGATF